MEIEKYSPKWLLEKINTSKTDAHKLMHIIEYRKEIIESTEKQFAIHSVVGQSEQLCQHDRSVTNRICDDCGSVITYVPDDELA